MTNINSVTIFPGDKFTVFSEGGDLEVNQAADNMAVLSVVVGGDPPPPRPGGGEVVFTEGFEDFPGEWEEDKGYFQKGNTNVHQIPPQPKDPKFGTFSLRMKVFNGLPGGGEFPEFESDAIRRQIQLEPGTYQATHWIVTNEANARMTFQVWEGLELLGAIYGTEGLDDQNWQPQTVAFETLTGDVELVYGYTAPKSTTEPSGMKVALLTIEALE